MFEGLDTLTPSRVSLPFNGVNIKLLPINFAVIIRIQQVLKTEENKNPYQRLVSEILAGNEAAMLNLIYFCLPEETFAKYATPQDFIDVVSKDKNISSSILADVVLKLIHNSAPDFQDSKKKAMKGRLALSFTVLILSIIGLMSLIYFAVDTIGRLQTSLN